VIINFLYTDTVMSELDGQVVIGVLLESQMMGIARLEQLCSKYIAARICDENVQDIYDLATQYELLALVKVCKYYSKRKNRKLSQPELAPLVGKEYDETSLLSGKYASMDGTEDDQRSVIV